jgi:hypothetical protein
MAPERGERVAFTDRNLVQTAWTRGKALSLHDWMYFTANGSRGLSLTSRDLREHGFLSPFLHGARFVAACLPRCRSCDLWLLRCWRYLRYELDCTLVAYTRYLRLAFPHPAAR